MSSQGFLRALIAVLVLSACAALLGPVAAFAAPTATIEGEVTAADGGAPVKEVLVCAYLVSGDESGEACDLTSAGGGYAVTGLEAGEYKVEFWPGFKQLNFSTQYYDDQEFWEEADPVEVAEGATVDEIDAELDEKGAIEGKVTAASGGAVIEGIEVCAFYLEEAEEAGCATTDAGGEYTIPGLSPGSYEVEFWPPPLSPFAVQYYDNHDRWQDADPVAVTTGTSTGIDAELKPAARIKGTVLSAATGAPLEEITVCTIDSFGLLYICTETLENGQYTVARLPSASYKVVFSPDFAEWFPGFESFDDGYATQFYNAKTTLAAADPLALLAPTVQTGVDARLASSQPTVLPITKPLTPTPIVKQEVKKKKRKHCRAGFRTKKVKGKRRCVKIHRKGKRRSGGTHAKRIQPHHLVFGGS